MTSSSQPSADLSSSAYQSPSKSPRKYNLTYYQQSFLKIVLFLRDKYRLILVDNEAGLLETLYALPDDPQRLFIRLFLRKDGWVRQCKLSYDEVDVDKGERLLFTKKLVDVLGKTVDKIITIESDHDDDKTDEAVMLGLLALDDLRRIWTALEIGKKRIPDKRDQLVQDILAVPARVTKNRLVSTDGCLKVKRACISKQNVLKEVCGPVIRLNPTVNTQLAQMISGLFFLNTTLVDESYMLTMNNAILADLNRHRYPHYALTDPLLIFPTRQRWLDFDAALHQEKHLVVMLESLRKGIGMFIEPAKKLFDEALEATEEVPCYFLRRYMPGWVHCRSLSNLAGELEKEGLFEEAVALYRHLLNQKTYCNGGRGKWWDRLALDVHRHLKQLGEAEQACIDGLADPHVRTASRYALQHRLAAIQNGKNGKHIHDPPVVCIDAGELYPSSSESALGGKKILFKLRSGKPGSVEAFALEHFAESGGWSGLHSESSVFTTIFALLFWDILFGPTANGVFPTAFQTAPLDLSTDAFYADRRAVIDERLAKTAADLEWCCQQITDMFEEHHGELVTGVRWEDPDGEHCALLCSIITHLGRKPLSVILRQLAEDYRHATAGMPDLVLWREVEKGEKNLMLVEVKSARDKLSDAQRHWYSILQANDIPMVVCRISRHF